MDNKTENTNTGNANNIVVIQSKKLSKPNSPRYIIADIVNKVVLDDAQGYGYRTVENAQKSWMFKQTKYYQNMQEEKSRRREINAWLDTQHWLSKALFTQEKLSETGLLRNESMDNQFNVPFVEKTLNEQGITSPYTSSEILDAWKHR